MKYGVFKNNNKLYPWLAIVAVAVLTAGYFGKRELYAQMMPAMNNTADQQHAEHTLDNLIVSEHIPLSGHMYILLVVIVAVYVAYDILKKRHLQKMPIMNVVWPVTVFYLFPLGLWAYWHLGHTYSRTSSSDQQHLVKSHEYTSNKTSRPFRESIFVSATHCGAGCTIGDVMA